MKKTLLFLLILLIRTAISGQIVTSTCTAPDSIKAGYTDDADRLALKRIFRNSLSYEDSLIIPKSYSDTVLNPLLAVYNALALPARDTVVNILHIHTFPDLPLRSFAIYADSNQAWMQQFRNGIIPTGVATVDSLINQFNISIIHYYAYGIFDSCHMVMLKTGRNCNIRALEKFWKSIPGVLFCVSDFIGGGGNTIQDSIYTDHVELVYSRAWGDCYSGCTNLRAWKFNVYFDCSVDYLGSYGDPLPPLSINEFNKKVLTITPNPFQDIISIHGISFPFTYSITNLTGQIIKVGNSANGEIENLNSIEPGFYLLTLKLNNQNYSFKIYKE